MAASGLHNAALLYDPLGRLFEVSSAATGTTRFLYDGDELVAEYDGLGAMIRRYVHGTGVDDPIAVYDGDSLGLANRRYTLPDQQGSIVALVNADGSPSVINTYDEYGIPGVANGGRFQYTGQAWIPELGMYHYKARLYSPTLGRFLQTDPVGYEDQINLYAYVGNDPINGTDSSGLCEDCFRYSRWGRSPARTRTAPPKPREHAAPSHNESRGLHGSQVTGGVAISVDTLADAAVETGGTARDVRPIKMLGKGVEGVGLVLAYDDYRDKGNSRTVSAAGALAEEGTGWSFTAVGAAIGTAVEPGGGTLAGAIVGFGIDGIFGIGDAVGNKTADGVRYVESGGLREGVNQIAAEALRRARGRRAYPDLYGE